MPTCYVHPEWVAGGFCVSCGKPICPDCTIEAAGKYHCKACVAQRFSKTKPLAPSTGRQLLGLAGCLLIVVGVFAPILNYIGVSETFFSQGQRNGSIVLALAAFSLVAVLAKKFRVLLITAGLTLIPVVMDFRKALNFSSDPVMNTGILGPPPKLAWGWITLFVGVALLIAAAWSKKHQSNDS